MAFEPAVNEGPPTHKSLWAYLSRIPHFFLRFFFVFPRFFSWLDKKMKWAYAARRSQSPKKAANLSGAQAMKPVESPEVLPVVEEPRVVAPAPLFVPAVQPVSSVMTIEEIGEVPAGVPVVQPSYVVEEPEEPSNEVVVVQPPLGVREEDPIRRLGGAHFAGRMNQMYEAGARFHPMGCSFVEIPNEGIAAVNPVVRSFKFSLLHSDGRTLKLTLMLPLPDKLPSPQPTPLPPVEKCWEGDVLPPERPSTKKESVMALFQRCFGGSYQQVIGEAAERERRYYWMDARRKYLEAYGLARHPYERNRAIEGLVRSADRAAINTVEPHKPFWRKMAAYYASHITISDPVYQAREKEWHERFGRAINALLAGKVDEAQHIFEKEKPLSAVEIYLHPSLAIIIATLEAVFRLLNRDELLKKITFGNFYSRVWSAEGSLFAACRNFLRCGRKNLAKRLYEIAIPSLEDFYGFHCDYDDKNYYEVEGDPRWDVSMHPSQRPAPLPSSNQISFAPLFLIAAPPASVIAVPVPEVPSLQVDVVNPLDEHAQPQRRLS